MRFIRRTLVVLAFLLATIGVAGAGVVLWFRQAGLPEHEGTLHAAKLSRPVRIARDEVGVPTIVAQSEADALFALGFVHAQDRLWQMELQRRIGQGRLAELLGPRAVDTDRALRTLGIYRRAQSMAAELDVETAVLLRAYCNGINAYLDQLRGPLPAEFFLLRASRPLHWSPADVLTWTLIMSWDLSSHGMRNELERLRLSARFDKSEIDDLLPSWDPAAPSVADYVRMYRDLGLPSQALAAPALKLAASLPHEGSNATRSQGSNSWVLAASRSTKASPMLANDPHLGLSSPSVWYFARLTAPGLNVFGATLPGVPYVVLGRNAHVAWGFTNTYADTQDIYIERIDPDHPDRYRAPEGYVAFDIHTESIQVRGADPVVVTVRNSRHGPVISDAFSSASLPAAAGYALALRWTALEPGDATLRAVRAMNRASDTREFQSALRNLGLIVQNVVFAGDDGHIGFRVAGRVPVRRADNDLYGVAPAPGWDARYDWQRWMEADELPHTLDPPSGMIVTANQKVTPPGYAGFLTTEWQAPFRADRIEQRLKEKPRHDIASFESIQADVTSLAARSMLQLLSHATPSTPLGHAALKRLLAWDGSMKTDSAEPLIYHAWIRRLTQRVFDAKLMPLAGRVEGEAGTAALLGVLSGRAHSRRWCDDAGAPQAPADCMGLAGAALDQAAADWAREPAGLDRLRWGREHPAVFEHRPFSHVGPLRRWFEQRVPQPGDDETVDVGHFGSSDEHPFEAVAGPSMRVVFDLSGPAAGTWMLAPGQSGNLFSEQYGDLLEAWSRVRYRPIEASYKATRTMILKPASE